ncbi:HipA domain-containing protein [Bdellovibrionota bacterium FG-1]
MKTHIRNPLKPKALSKKLLLSVQFKNVEASSSGWLGDFDKYTFKDQNGSEYLIKVGQDKAKNLPEVEFLSNQISSILGVEVADFGLWTVDGKKAFATKDFLKNNPKIPETAGLIHFKRYFKTSGRWACEDILDLLKKQSSRSAHDIRQFIRLTLVDALIGNTDRHAYNLAFIHEDSHLYLSPIYDTVSVFVAVDRDPYEDFIDTCKIGTKDQDTARFEDYLTEFKRLGFAKEVTVVLTAMTSKKNKIFALIQKSKLPLIKKEYWCDRINKTIKSLK